MKTITSSLALCALLASGCFDEGGNDGQKAAMIATAEGLVAFGDLHKNLASDNVDAAAAGQDLLAFMKWPVAADQLVNPPFDVTAVLEQTAERTLPHGEIPACIATTGEAGCDEFVASECEAGGFKFSGHAARRCGPCDNVEGVCSYNWSIPNLQFTSTSFDLAMSTRGSWVGSASGIFPNLSASWNLRDNAGGPTTRFGSIAACACTNFTVETENLPGGGKRRKLVNSAFIVRSFIQETTQRCALVTFDGDGVPSAASSCSCANGDVCEPLPPPTNRCGDGLCDAEEFISCPVDCADSIATCGDGACTMPPETQSNCPTDCGTVAPLCGNGVCEFGENVESCRADCFVPFCGDSVCDAIEASSCPADCAP